MSSSSSALAPSVARRSAVVASLVTILSWSSVFPATRFGLASLAPFDFVALRILLTGLLLGGALIATRAPLPSRREAVGLVICAFFGVAVYNFLLGVGLVTLSAGAASFLTNTIPVFAAILSFIINREKPRALALLGMAVSFAGVGLLASGQPGGLAFGSGATLVLLAALCSGLYIVLQGRLVATMTPLQTASWLMVISAVMMLPFSHSALASLTRAPANVWLIIAYLALVPGAIGQVSWLRVLERVPAGRAAALLFLVPPLATLIGVAALDETLSISLLTGGALAIGGVALVYADGRRAA